MAHQTKPLTRLLSVRDYAAGQVKRKPWEVALALQTLSALPRDAVVLGVGAGKEATLYALSTKVGKVIATDLYQSAGMWNKDAPEDMLTDPAKYAPVGAAFDASRIDVRHMDARALDLPDESVDAVFSCSSIEHFGTWEDIAQAASEIGRVLKPGGVASICTEFKLSGEGDGWEGVKLFDRQRLIDCLITPSGLTLADNAELAFVPDADTLATAWPLHTIVTAGEWPEVEGVLSEHGYLFTSVHVALTKPAARNERGLKWR